MPLNTKQKTLLLCSLLVSGFCFAQVSTPTHSRRDNFRDIRWLGRGNTGVAAVNDGTAAFYNPAALGRIDTYSFQLVNPAAGGGENFYTTAKEISSLTDSAKSMSDRFSPFLGKPLGTSAHVFPHAATPNFVMGFYDYLDFSILYRDPVYPSMTIDGRNDYGLVIGTGFQLVKNFYLGASLRYVKRQQLYEGMTAGSLMGDPSGLVNSIRKKGEAFGLNVGALYFGNLSSKLVLGIGAAVEDVGMTKFRGTRGLTPVPQVQMVNFGSVLGLRIKYIEIDMLFDTRNTLDSKVHYTKKIFMGTEVRLPIFDIRGGMHHGYWAGGLSMAVLPFMDIDFSTYADELDYAAGLRANRIWMLGIRMGIAIKKKQGRRQRFTL